VVIMRKVIQGTRSEKGLENHSVPRLCFLAYIATAFQDFRLSGCQRFSLSACPPDPPPSTLNRSEPPQSQISDLKSPIIGARSAAVVLLVGLWFDGGLFHLATAAPLWILLELGRGEGSPPRHRGTEETDDPKLKPRGDPEGPT
jgi:hypothetical protein